MSETTIPGIPASPRPGTAALSDLEIAQRATMRPIEEIAAAAGINAEALDFHGRYKAKIDPAKLTSSSKSSVRMARRPAVSRSARTNSPR